MITLTDHTQVNQAVLEESLKNSEWMTCSTEADWTPEGQVVKVASKDYNHIQITIQHDQVIDVYLTEYTVSTYLPNGTDWNTYAVDEDEDNFEDLVSEQIMMDIKEAFN